MALAVAGRWTTEALEAYVHVDVELAGHKAVGHSFKEGIEGSPEFMVK